MPSKLNFLSELTSSWKFKIMIFYSIAYKPKHNFIQKVRKFTRKKNPGVNERKKVYHLPPILKKF